MKKIILSLSVLFQLHAGAQNVGIGTHTPARAKLEVHGGVGISAAIFGGGNRGVSLYRTRPGIGFNQYKEPFYPIGKFMSNGPAAELSLDTVSGNMVLEIFKPNVQDYSTYPNPVLSVSPDGHLAVGRSQQNAALTVSKIHYSTYATAYLLGSKHHTAVNWGPTEDTYIRAGRDSGKVIINDIPGGIVALNGPVGINTATPVMPLEIRQKYGHGLVLVHESNFNNWEFVAHNYPNNPESALQFRYNRSTRGYINPSNGSYNSISDRRLKTNISLLNPVLGKVMQLQPVEYEMINSNPNHEKTLGFIAQDVKAVFPELSRIISDTLEGRITDIHTLNYSGFGVLAIKAIQEQQQTIESQQITLDRQQAEINELKKAVGELRKQQSHVK